MILWILLILFQMAFQSVVICFLYILTKKISSMEEMVKRDSEF